MTDDSARAQASRDREGYWAAQAAELSWFERWDTVLSWEPPFAGWFLGGRLSAAFNCLDRHVEAGLGDRVAYHYEDESGGSRTISYAGLLDEAGRCGNALRRLGIERGDRVAVCLPAIPELAVTVLACARIGATYVLAPVNVPLFELRRRIEEVGARALVTADGAFAGGALPVEHVLVVQRPGTSLSDLSIKAGRDIWWHEVVACEEAHCPLEAMAAEDLLYLLHSPRAGGGAVMGGTGGFLAEVASSHRYVFDVRPESDVYWCTSPASSAIGHSHALWGPLVNGATSVLCEWTPALHPERAWSIIERHGVTTLYAGAATIRTFTEGGADSIGGHDVSSLRLLASAGALGRSKWTSYSELLGGGRPMLDTWMQEESGAIMLSSIPGVTTPSPGSAAVPLPGITAEVVDDAGRTVQLGEGHLTFSEPWPSMPRGIYEHPERYRDLYWSRFPGRFDAGVRARFDAAGHLSLA